MADETAPPAPRPIPVINAPPAPRRIPVIILTGFLGAGKTTLLNNWLVQLMDGGRHQVKRVALIENEFASAFGVVENELLPGHDHESVQSLLQLHDLYEFGFGCVCCSSSGELRRVLAEIAARQGLSEAAVPDPFSDLAAFGGTGTFSALPGTTASLDLVILETTGLADPAPVSDVVTLDPSISPYFDLLGVVGVVDSGKVYREVISGADKGESDAGDFKNEPLAQLLGSDLVVLSKTDLLPSDASPPAEKVLSDYIASHRPGFPSDRVFRSARGDGAPSLDRTVEILSTPWGGERGPADPRPHDPGVTHVPILAPEGSYVDTEKLQANFAAFFAANPGVVLRVKGFLRTRQAGDRKVVLHGVGDGKLEFEVGRPWGGEEERRSTVTVIGRNVRKFKDDLQSIVDSSSMQ
ncbi:CobW/HypB/UreG, nucleotide-binding domain-containing protein [Hyaloraphidium curvatum]|nr:CobW/HypB/UreG, nucleotide-binding domain-containing protein [Hyaloraphidium curvatum]